MAAENFLQKIWILEMRCNALDIGLPRAVVMLFRSKTSILYYFLFLYKFSVLYHSKCVGKYENGKFDFYLTKISHIYAYLRWLLF